MFKLLLILLILSVASAKYLYVPSGKQLHQDCVHNIPSHSFSLVNDPSGKSIVTTADGQVLIFPPCPHAPKQLIHGPAWKAWTQYQNPAKITELYGEWTVPPSPFADDGQILYYWNGVEPSDNSAVLQPVLQWGSTPAGGGEYWGVASWYVSSTNAFYTMIMNVNVGDVVTGHNKILNNGSWVITGGKRGSPQTVSLTYRPPRTDYTYAFQVLEAYDIKECQRNYPRSGNIVFDNIFVFVDGNKVPAIWETMTQDTITCNERAGVASPTEVSISWN